MRKILKSELGTPGITLCRAAVRRSQCSSRRSRRRQCVRRSSWQRVRNSAYLSYGRVQWHSHSRIIIDNLTDPSSPCMYRLIPFTSPFLLLLCSSLSSFSLLAPSSSRSLFNNVLLSRAFSPQIPIYTYARPPTSVLAAAPKSETSHNLSTLCDRERKVREESQRSRRLHFSTSTSFTRYYDNETRDETKNVKNLRVCL